MTWISEMQIRVRAFSLLNNWLTDVPPADGFHDQSTESQQQ